MSRPDFVDISEQQEAPVSASCLPENFQPGRSETARTIHVARPNTSFIRHLALLTRMPDTQNGPTKFRWFSNEGARGGHTGAASSFFPQVPG